MRIKTRYLLLVPLVLIMLISMINVTMVIINNETEHKITGWEMVDIISYSITGFILITFIILWFVENWNKDFYINLKFKNKSRES